MLDLTPEQLMLMQDGLNEVLRLENTDKQSSNSLSKDYSSIDPKSDQMQKKNELIAMKIRELKQKGVKKLDPLKVLK